jgi:8-oxo-dGTP diphosphatase
MSEERHDIIGVVAVASNEAGEILLIRTRTAGWELPGGRVEQGEDFITALKREVREETGCEIDVGRLTGITSSTSTPHTTMFTFLCQHISGDTYPGDDSLDAGWFAPDVAINLVTHAVEHLRLRDAIGEDQGVVYRAYRKLPDENLHHDRYEMLHLHRC